jgi:iron complex outermembrane receptor protein
MSLLPANFTGDEVFQVTTPINTPGGKLNGFEINWQQPFTFLPGALKNAGVLLNYTQVKSKIAYQVSPTSATTITDDLLNMSPRRTTPRCTTTTAPSARGCRARTARPS